MIGVSTLEAMARNVAMAEGIYCAAMDARRNQVYTALFEFKNGVFSRLVEDSAISIAELSEQLKDLKQTVYLVGDGAALCYRMLEDASGLVLLPEHLRMQRAAGSALVAWEQLQTGALTPAKDITPNYLRLSQAERERQKKLEME